MSFTTCSDDYVPNYINDMKAHIQDVEKILTIYDKSVQEALDNDENEAIPSLASNAAIALSVKKERIESLLTNKSVAKLQESALAYLDAVEAMIKAEEVYADYSENTTIEDARLMDAYNIEAKNNLEKKKSEYLKEKKQLESDFLKTDEK